jgi:hypothetical protein
MTLFRAAFFLIFAISGGIIAREDFSVGKIRNKWLARIFAVCVVGYGLQFALSVAGHFGLAHRYLFYRFYPAAAIHIAISLAAALALWILDIWPAGDAKLFILCATFVPLINPTQRAFPYYLSLNLLVNTFVLAALFILASVTVSLAKELKALGIAGAMAKLRSWPESATRALRERAARWKESVPVAVNTAGLFLAQTIARPILAGRLHSWASSPIIIYLLLFALWDNLKRFVSNGPLALVSGVGVMAFIASGLFGGSARPLLAPFLARWLGFGVFFGPARALLDLYVTKRASRLVDCRDIAPGMILSEESLAFLRRDREYFSRHFTPIFKDGLSAAQAQALKQWLLGLPAGSNSIEILNAAPFGVWIIVGTLFTLAARRDAASLAIALFR